MALQRRRGLLVVTAVMAIGLALAGCGDDEPKSTGSSGATAGSGRGGGGGGGGGNDEREAALVKYAQCMRDNGVASFPDPVGGRLQLQARRGSELDPENPTFQAAQKACKALEPPGLMQQGAQPEQQEAMLKFVKCMRENGVPNMPDPQPDGRMLIDRGAGVDPESSAYKAAQDKCRNLLPGGVAPGGGS
ncbi:hypothetical protein [Luedemannella helvata]|uniref:Uncharacterized protein n=1 Tax=Luedemannella helvata TaxID=349315 RepID=A0ABP4X562_9ACTN